MFTRDVKPVAANGNRSPFSQCKYIDVNSQLRLVLTWLGQYRVICEPTAVSYRGCLQYETQEQWGSVTVWCCGMSQCHQSVCQWFKYLTGNIPTECCMEGQWIFLPNVKAIHLMVVTIFHMNQKMSLSWRSERKNQDWCGDLERLFKTPKSYWDISVWIILLARL